MRGPCFSEMQKHFSSKLEALLERIAVVASILPNIHLQHQADDVETP